MIFVTWSMITSIVDIIQATGRTLAVPDLPARAVVNSGRSGIDLHVGTIGFSISANAQGPQNEDAVSCRQ